MTRLDLSEYERQLLRNLLVDERDDLYNGRSEWAYRDETEALEVIDSLVARLTRGFPYDITEGTSEPL